MLPRHHAGRSVFPRLPLHLYHTSAWGSFSPGSREVTNTPVHGAGRPLAGDERRREGPSPAESPAARPAARGAHGARTGRQAPAVATCCSRRMLHVLLWGKKCIFFFFLCFFCVTVHVASVGVRAHRCVRVCVCARRCVSSFPVFQFMQKRRCVFNLLQ